MIYITQLVYLKEGQESVFDEFEAHAIPLIKKYNGELMFRLRPDETSIIEKSEEAPYEIHLVKFESPSGFEGFMKDEERTQFLHLKEKSIRSSLVVVGKKL